MIIGVASIQSMIFCNMYLVQDLSLDFEETILYKAGM